MNEDVGPVFKAVYRSPCISCEDGIRPPQLIQWYETGWRHARHNRQNQIALLRAMIFFFACFLLLLMVVIFTP